MQDARTLGHRLKTGDRGRDLTLLSPGRKQTTNDQEGRHNGVVAFIARKSKAAWRTQTDNPLHRKRQSRTVNIASGIIGAIPSSWSHPGFCYSEWHGGLRVKANHLILQGPPGHLISKTWLAKKLAYALIGQKDGRDKVRLGPIPPINLSYEDFNAAGDRRKMERWTCGRPLPGFV